MWCYCNCCCKPCCPCRDPANIGKMFQYCCYCWCHNHTTVYQPTWINYGTALPQNTISVTCGAQNIIRCNNTNSTCGLAPMPVVQVFCSECKYLTTGIHHPDCKCSCHK